MTEKYAGGVNNSNKADARETEDCISPLTTFESEDSQISSRESFSLADDQSLKNLLKDKISKIAISIKKTMLPLVGLSILVGICCGLIIGVYMSLVRFIVDLSQSTFRYISEKTITYSGNGKPHKSMPNLIYLPVALLVSGTLGMLSGVICHFFPEIKGSGIPYIECVARGVIQIRWYFALPMMLFVSCMSYFTGMALGPEGPAIYIGGCIGDAIGCIFNLDSMNIMLLVAAGSSAGMSVAFNAPLSGLIFSIEEVYRKSSIHIIIATIITVSACEISNHLAFKSSYLDIGEAIHEKFTIIPFCISVVTGIIGGFVGSFFNWLLRFSVRLYQKIPLIKDWTYPVIPAMLSIFVGIWWPSASYAGEFIMKATLKNDVTFQNILITFILKFLFVCICFGSRTPGGMLIPLLTLGSLLGGIVGKVCIILGVGENRFAYISLMTMSSFFTGVVRAPLTAAILPVEYTEQYSGWLGPITAVAFSYLVSEILQISPLYEALMETIKNGEDENQEPYNFVFIVNPNSVICGMMIREIVLPENSIIISIQRDSVSIFPTENTNILAGDELVIGTTTSNPISAERLLSVMF